MKSSSYQFIFVVIHVVISSHYICLISASCAMPDPIPNTITTLPNQTLDTGSYITLECTDGYMMDGLTNTAVWVCLEDGSWLGHTPICKGTCSTTNTARYSNLTCYRRRGFGNWYNTFNRCTKQGDILATVKDAQTQEFLVDFLGTFNDGDNIWIGAREGRDWKWRTTDKYIERFFWQNPFPDSNPRDCIELSYQSGSAKYSWNPRSFLEENALLCQYDQPCQSFGLTQSSMVLEYMGTCFQFLNVSMTCANGGEECERRGGFLAEILDESTNALLIDQALYLRNNSFVGEDTAWWIGGYDDENNERSWYWSDQTRLIFEAWGTGQPNEEDDDCVRMGFDFQYEWTDWPCSEGHRALCQIGIPACGDPGEPLHGNRSPDDRTTYSVDATLHFTCQEGYTLSGESVLRCMNNGAWNRPRPSCEAVECEGSPPGVALASTMKLGSVYQDIAVYTCEDGYIPDQAPISFCQHTGNWSTPNFTCLENLEGNSSSNRAAAAGSVVAILFILAVIILTVILFRRRRTAKPVIPVDENVMENHAVLANCYEDRKPANSYPHAPYYPTVEADIDQNGGFGDSVAEQPSLHLDFVDNVLYGTIDEQTVRPSSLNRNSTDQSPGRPKLGHPRSGAPETDEDAYEGYEDEEIMVDNEVYGASFPTTPRGQKVGPVVVQGDDAVYEITDGNDPVDRDGDGEMYQNTEFHSVPSDLTANELYKSVDEI